MSTAPSLAHTYALALFDAGFELRGLVRGRLVLGRESENVAVVLVDEVEGDPLEPLGAPAALVLFGGGERAAELTKRARDSDDFSEAHHVTEQRLIWPPVEGEATWQTALQKVEDGPLADEHAFRDRLASEVEKARGAQDRLQRFQALLSGRRPVATYALLALIGLFFVVELAVGALEDTSKLVQMGALLRWPQLDGELWRIPASVFLHGGWMHVGFNGFVLYVLGRSLERILGTRRFLVLFALAGFGGGIASTTLLSGGFSVGASGAIWGLLGAEAALAYRPSGILPAHALPAMKKAAMFNLGINVLNSFRPHVDWAGHFGGGLVGGLLVFSGLILIGVPRLDAPTEAYADRPPAILSPLAIVLTALLVGGALYGPLAGQPWRPDGPPRLVPERMGDIALLRPEGMPGRPPDNPSPAGATVRVFGDMMRERVVVEVVTAKNDHTFDEPGLDAAVRETRPAVVEAPEGAIRDGPVRSSTAAGARFLFATYEVDPRVRIERAVRIDRTRSTRIDVLLTTERGAQGWGDLAERMIRSVRTASTTPGVTEAGPR